MNKLFDSPEEQRGAQKLLELQIRYFINYPEFRFTGASVICLIYWWRENCIDPEEKERFDAELWSHKE